MNPLEKEACPSPWLYVAGMKGSKEELSGSLERDRAFVRAARVLDNYDRHLPVKKITRHLGRDPDTLGWQETEKKEKNSSSP